MVFQEPAIPVFCGLLPFPLTQYVVAKENFRVYIRLKGSLTVDGRQEGREEGREDIGREGEREGQVGNLLRNMYAKS